MSTQTLPVIKTGTDIKRGKLFGIISKVKGAKFTTVTIETDPRMNKFGRTKDANGNKVPNKYFGVVLKRTRMNVTINFIYENSVNTQRGKEGNEKDFEAAPRKWGEHIEGTPFIMHEAKIYLETKPNGAPQSVEYFDQTTGELVDVKLLEDYLPVKKSNAEHQGVEKEILVRDILWTSLKEMKIDGENYIIVD